MPCRRSEALPCESELPPQVAGGQYSQSEVPVIFGAGTANETLVPKSDCSAGDGWKYDQEPNPTRIILCPSACSTLKSTAGASIDVRLGCPTIVK